MSLVVAQDQDVEEGYMSPRQQVEEESLVLLLDLLIYPSFLSGVLLRVRLFLLFWMITMMPGDADLHQVIFYLSGNYVEEEEEDRIGAWIYKTSCTA